MNRIVLAAAMLFAISACVAHAAPEAANLLQNPGFETPSADGQPTAWLGPSDVYSQVSGPVHSGQGALQFVNQKADYYAVCSQTIHLEVGKAYEFSGWVKSEGIEGKDTGASFCLQWGTADDQWLGGSYPAGVKGTTDWTQIKGITTGRLPEKAAKLTIVCYVRQSMTGKAWFETSKSSAALSPSCRPCC